MSRRTSVPLPRTDQYDVLSRTAALTTGGPRSCTSVFRTSSHGRRVLSRVLQPLLERLGFVVDEDYLGHTSPSFTLDGTVALLDRAWLQLVS